MQSVRADVRIDYVEFSYVSGGLRITIDGTLLLRTGNGGEYLEYLLDTTLSEMLSALESALQTGEPATATAGGTGVTVLVAPIDDERVRLSVQSPNPVHPASREGYVVHRDELCSEVLACARKVSWACEADAQSMDWPDELAEFDHSGKEHYLREKIASLGATK